MVLVALPLREMMVLKLAPEDDAVEFVAVDDAVGAEVVLWARHGPRKASSARENVVCI